MSKQTPPRWDLSNVYPSLSSKEFAADTEKLKRLISEMEVILKEKAAVMSGKEEVQELTSLALSLIDDFNELLLTTGTLGAYIHSFIATDSYNKEALRKESEFDQVAVKLDQLQVLVLTWIGRVADRLPEMFRAEPKLEAHRYFIEESARQSKYLMSESEEMLASELSLTGSTAWSKTAGYDHLAGQHRGGSGWRGEKAALPGAHQPALAP